MPRYVALLRGINVGGKNPIPMAALAACFEQGGYGRVATYIQSGNVLFDSPERSAKRLGARIEAMLGERFAYRATVALRTTGEMRRIVDAAPRGFGADPEAYRYDVWFLMPPVTAKAALPSIPVKEGVDTLAAGPGVIYAARLAAKATQSRLNRVVGLPIYPRMTIRNWNTTTKLLALMETEPE